MNAVSPVCRLVCYPSIYKQESSLKLSRQHENSQAQLHDNHAAIINVFEEGWSSPTGFMKWRFTSDKQGPKTESRQGKLPSLPWSLMSTGKIDLLTKKISRSRGSMVEFWAAGWSHQKLLLDSASKNCKLCPTAESGESPLYSKQLKIARDFKLVLKAKHMVRCFTEAVSWE